MLQQQRGSDCVEVVLGETPNADILNMIEKVLGRFIHQHGVPSVRWAGMWRARGSYLLFCQGSSQSDDSASVTLRGCKKAIVLLMVGHVDWAVTTVKFYLFFKYKK
jgi:hypothetical protein